MIYVSLVSDDDGIRSTAIFDDAVWQQHRDRLTQVVRGAGADFLTSTSREDLKPVRNVHSLGDANAWIADALVWR